MLYTVVSYYIIHGITIVARISAKTSSRGTKYDVCLAVINAFNTFIIGIHEKQSAAGGGGP